MKKKTKNRAELLPEDELENVGTIESSIELDTLTLKKKRWNINLIVGTILPKSFHQYRINLDLDEKPYTDRMDQLQKDLDNSLFKEEKVSKKTTLQRISDIKKELDAMRRDCEHIEFVAIVQEIKYRDNETLVSARIPDDDDRSCDPREH